MAIRQWGLARASRLNGISQWIPVNGWIHKPQSPPAALVLSVTRPEGSPQGAASKLRPTGRQVL